jgi:hypothetical protein
MTRATTGASTATSSRRWRAGPFSATFASLIALIGQAASATAGKEPMVPRATLSASPILGVLSLASTVQAFDRTCATQGAQRQAVGRCVAAMTVPETVVYGTMSDHGTAVGERYDAQGNPIDHQGNIIAVPAGRSGSGREVFVQEPAFR